MESDTNAKMLCILLSEHILRVLLSNVACDLARLCVNRAPIAINNSAAVLSVGWNEIN